MEINIIRSETWLNDSLVDINSILQETVRDFVTRKDKIVNIQVRKEDTGLSRFWIYVLSPEKEKTLPPPLTGKQ